jgi:uncharacterized protein (TIGR02270 family)
VLWDVVEEHLEEAEFLIEQWCAAARSPRYSLRQLQKTVEPRLLAHLDGLVVGGKAVADEVLWPALIAEEADVSLERAAAAALALLQEGDGLGRIVETLLRTPKDPVRRGIGLALRMSPADVDERVRGALYESDVPAVHAVLLRILAARRVEAGPILPTVLASADPAIVVAALGAAAVSSGQPELVRPLDVALDHPDARIRAAAQRTALIWNLRSGWQSCLMSARSGAPDALLALGLLGRPEDLPTLLDALGSARKAAAFALGFTGRVEAADACLDLLGDPDEAVAALAGESFACLTGLPVDERRFLRPRAPEDDSLPPLEEDLAKDLTPVPTDELPLLNPDEVRAWWSRRGQYSPKQRYIGGQPITAESHEVALATASLRRSGLLALEVAVRTAGEVQLPALRMGYTVPTLPRQIVFTRTPSWR